MRAFRSGVVLREGMRGLRRFGFAGNFGTASPITSRLRVTVTPKKPPGLVSAPALTPERRPDPGNRDAELRRAESHVSPSQRCLRPEQGVRVILVGPDRPCRPSDPGPREGRRPPSHPSVQADRSGRSRPYRLWALEAPEDRARPYPLWAQAVPGGPERPRVLLDLLAQAGVADWSTAWSACSPGLRAHPGGPIATACGKRLVWRHAPSWLGLSVFLVWPFSCLGFVPWHPPT